MKVTARTMKQVKRVLGRRETLRNRAEDYVHAFRKARGRILGEVPNWRLADKRVIRAETELWAAIRESRKERRTICKQPFFAITTRAMAVVVVSSSGNLTVYDAV